MPELTHDTEDGFHEIQLSGKQLVFLFMATTVVSVVIFLCGVLVGREFPGDIDPSIDSSLVDPGGSKSPEPAPTSAAELPPPVSEPDLTYPKRLQQEPGNEELNRPQPEPQPAPSRPAPPAPAPPLVSEATVPTSPARPGAWFLQVIAVKNRDAAARTVRRLIGKGYPAFLENPPAGTPLVYRVRVGKYGTRDEAEQVWRRLQKEEQITSDIRR